MTLDDDAIVDQLREAGGGLPAVSYLQRRFGLPYRRAAMLRERLAAAKLVGPSAESGESVDTSEATAE